MTTKVLYGAIGVGAAALLSICDLCKAPAEAATVRAVTTPSFSSSAVPAQARKTVTLDVQGMTCGGCVIGVRTVLTRLPGVAKADVRYETHQAVVTYDPTKVTVARMIAAIATLHYAATAVAG